MWFLILLLPYALSFTEDCGVLNVPSQYQLFLELSSWHKTVTGVEMGGDSESPILTAVRTCGSSRDDFSFHVGDEDGALVSNVQVALVSWGMSAWVYACDSEEEEDRRFHLREGADEVIMNALTIPTEYQVYDAKENLLGYARKTEYFDEFFNLTDLSGSTVATAIYSAATLSLDRSYNITIHNTSSPLADSRIISSLVTLRLMSSKSSDGCTSFMHFGLAFVIVAALLVLLLLFQLVQRYRRGEAMPWATWRVPNVCGGKKFGA
jgi:hypothetical protein